MRNAEALPSFVNHEPARQLPDQPLLPNASVTLKHPGPFYFDDDKPSFSWQSGRGGYFKASKLLEKVVQMQADTPTLLENRLGLHKQTADCASRLVSYCLHANASKLEPCSSWSLQWRRISACEAITRPTVTFPFLDQDRTASRKYRQRSFVSQLAPSHFCERQQQTGIQCHA